jgi:nucleotide-binding universal stress UspA family protein
MFTSILIACDGSPSSENAFDTAVDVALKYRARLSVVAVARPSEFAEDVETEAIIESAQDNLEQRFADLKDRCRADTALCALCGSRGPLTLNTAT